MLTAFEQSIDFIKQLMEEKEKLWLKLSEANKRIGQLEEQLRLADAEYNDLLDTVDELKDEIQALENEKVTI